MDWTNFSFHCDEFGNSKTWWNWIIPNKNVGITWRVSDCEELVGEVNHTTECVTDLFWIVDFEWGFV